MRIDAVPRLDRRGSGRTGYPCVALLISVLLLLGAAAAAQGASGGPSIPGVRPATADTPHVTAHTTNGTVSTHANSPSTTDACAPVSNGTARPDPDGDPLGWENGCWHDESIDVDQRDGLNESELDAVVARTMARVEHVRQLEFVEPVRVEVISRQAFEDRVEEGFAVSSERRRLRMNVKWEALLMVGEDEDAVDVRRASIGQARAYYSPSRERIVVVSPDATSARLSETTLAHELVHPLQVQHFDVADRFDLATFEQRRTTESLNAINSLLEGDAEFVRMRYRERCDAEWDCLPPPRDTDGGQGGGNAGMALLTGYPYLDGPTFVHRLYTGGGWEAVNGAYGTPPASTREVVYPEHYPADEPPSVNFTDTSQSGWTVPGVDTGQPDYVAVGEPGLTSMMLYTDLDGDNERSPVVTLRNVLNSTDGGVSRTDPFVPEENFYTSGLVADRLYPYVTDRSSGTGETGYVWKLVFESENDSAEFVDGYVRVIEYHGARPVDGRTNTYRIPEGEPFADAFYVERTGTTVYVVNAPTVEELSEVRAGAAPRAGGPFSLPFDDEPTWVLVTILVLVVAVAGLAGRLLYVLYHDRTTEPPVEE